MKIIEFYNQHFITNNYLFIKPANALGNYIDFYWESNYPANQHFTVKTFPRIGSTLLFNLGSGFQIAKGKFTGGICDEIYYLRNHSITSEHRPGNHIFGIQFKINLPVLLKKGKSSDFMNMYPGSQFIPKEITKKLRERGDFSERVAVVEEYFCNRITEQHEWKALQINRLIDKFSGSMENGCNMEELRSDLYCSEKTMSRHFQECLGISPKKAITLIRARQSLHTYLNKRREFDPFLLGYYDKSHFYKEMKEFIK